MQNKRLYMIAPLILGIGAAALLVNSITRSDATLNTDTITNTGAAAQTEPGDAPYSLPGSYGGNADPIAITWFERAEKKRKAGRHAIAQDYYDRALERANDDIKDRIARLYWSAPDGFPHDAEAAFALMEKVGDIRRRQLYTLVADSYRMGALDHIAVDDAQAKIWMDKADALAPVNPYAFVPPPDASLYDVDTPLTVIDDTDTTLEGVEPAQD